MPPMQFAGQQPSPYVAGGHSVVPLRFQTLVAAFEHWTATKPSHAALSYFGRQVTWGELDAEVEAVAAGLQARGVGAGDRVMIQLQNQPEFVVGQLAAWRIGAVIVPVSPMYKPREVRKLLSDCEAVALLTARGTWNEQGFESVEGTSVRLVLTTGMSDFGAAVPPVFATLVDPPRPVPGSAGVEASAYGDLIRERATARHGRVGPEDMALIEYTSGTTGEPKGVEAHHRNLMWAATAFVHCNLVEDEDNVVLAIAPLSHITGQTLHLGAWLASGARLVLGYRMQPDYYSELFVSEGVTWTTGTATAYLALLGSLEAHPRAFPRLRVLASGGAAVPFELVARVRDAFGQTLRPGYGLTESSSACVTFPPGAELRAAPGSSILSVGLAQGETQVKVIDPEGTVLPFGELGEICLKGPSVSSGYWRKPEETAATFVDGWLRTGDVGLVDADEFVYVLDRTKNMISSSGFKVWPREVEEVLYQLDFIREVAVIGVPDEYRGENVVAVVSARPGREIDVPAVITHARKNLAAYKVPRRIEVVPDIPKNPNGKIVHKDVRAALLAVTDKAES